MKKFLKKLLNKLFERLGYMPKKIALLNAGLQLMDSFTEQIKYAPNTYFIMSTNDGYLIVYGIFSMLPIKFYPFGDDKEYARLCAEELCEKLNEKI